MTILQKKYYFGEKDLFPEEITKGNVLYDAENNGLYIDTESERNLINPPEIWIKCKKKDSWEEIIENQNYATDYEIGKTVDLDFGEYGVHPMELVAIDADIRADGDTTKNNGKARMTWISKDIIAKHIMNSTEISNWLESEMRSWLRSDVQNQMPNILKNNIIEVTKTYYIGGLGDETFSTSDTVWIPSMRELVGPDGDSDEYWEYVEESGVDYFNKYNSLENRIKRFNESAEEWWTRSAYSNKTGFGTIRTNGIGDWASPKAMFGVVIGFCL